MAIGIAWADGSWDDAAWASGAWASASDVTAPTLSSPAGVGTGTTTASGSVSTNEANGTLYWVVTQSVTSPSVAQVQAGQNHLGAAADASGNQAVSITGTQNVNATGLTAETTYYIHFQHQDASANDSTVSSSTSFLTQAEPPATRRSSGGMSMFAHRRGIR